MTEKPFQLTTTELTNESPNAFGLRKYKNVPRIGEWIEIEENETAFMFEVIMIVHPSDGDRSHVYLKRLSSSLESVSRLREAASEKKHIG